MARSLPDEPAAPVLVYMLLRVRLVTNVVSQTLTEEQLRNVVDDSVAHATTDPWLGLEISIWIVFHTVAQAVCVHDIAFFVLRCKLDYLGTLKIEKLLVSSYRYRRPCSPDHQNP